MVSSEGEYITQKGKEKMDRPYTILPYEKKPVMNIYDSVVMIQNYLLSYKKSLG